MVAIQLLTTYFITKVMDLSHFDGKWQTITLYWKFYMLFILLLRMITKNFEPIWLIPPEFNTASWKTKVLTSALFSNAFRTVFYTKFG
jgi:hypothetical protein